MQNKGGFNMMELVILFNKYLLSCNYRVKFLKKVFEKFDKKKFWHYFLKIKEAYYKI